MIRNTVLGVLGALLVCGGSAAAQGLPRPDSAAAGSEPRLVFEREVYSYPGAAGRRDPFRPLTGANDAGPVFGDLKLRMILYLQTNPSRSVASVADASGKVHRLRRGDVIGNATVLDIGPERVLFSVEDFGLRRQEVLLLKPTNGKERTR